MKLNNQHVPISVMLAKELSALGERISGAFDLCRDEKESEAMEDVLQDLTHAKKTLDNAVSQPDNVVKIGQNKYVKNYQRSKKSPEKK